MKKESAEFEFRLTDGDGLFVPNEVLKRLNIGLGSKVRVRVTAGGFSGALKRRNVTEEEIEHIASLQLAPRENVVRFLETESSLSGNKRFKTHAQALRSRS